MTISYWVIGLLNVRNGKNWEYVQSLIGGDEKESRKERFGEPGEEEKEVDERRSEKRKGL